MSTASPSSSLHLASSATPHLHTDVLGHMFAFLPYLHQHVRLTQVCHQWRNAMKSMKPLDALLNVSSLDTLVTLPSCPLARHIGFAVSHVLPLSTLELHCLSSHLSSLKELRCGLNLAVEGRICFPPLLTTLVIWIKSQGDEWEQKELFEQLERVNEVFEAVGELNELEEFHVRGIAVEPVLYSDFLIHPLLQCKKLHSMDFDRCDIFEASKLCEVWRQMPSLTQLYLFYDDLTLEFLQTLLKQPHQLKLKDMGLRCTDVCDEEAMLIAGVPTLTSLPLWSIRVSNLDWLTHLTQLTHLRLAEMHKSPAVTAHEIVSALAHLPLLAQLHLGYAPVLSSHMRIILQQHPALIELFFEHCRDLETLEWLQSDRSSSSSETHDPLQSLGFRRCTQLSAKDLHFLRSHSSSLVQLHVHQCFDMTEEEVDEWKQILPVLSFAATIWEQQ